MPRRIFTGIVVSDKSDKTVTVKVEKSFLHPVYKKRIRHHIRYHAHDEGNVHKIGDVVSILESKPISKTKKWVVIEPTVPEKTV